MVVAVPPLWCGESCSSESQYRCGDHCVERDIHCQCGHSNFTYQDWHLEERLCCVQPGTCRREGQEVSCPGGLVIHKYNESCAGDCWDNESYFGCATTGDKCVVYRELCHGYPVCQDRSDVSYCTEDMACKVPPFWTVPNRCGQRKQSDIGHAECYYDYTGNNNGQYDCLDRTDEDVIMQATSSYVNYSAIVQRIDKWEEINGTRLPSIRCDDGEKYKDRKNWVWCNNITDYTCVSVSVKNPFLCQNHTFWNMYKNETDCNIYFGSGSVQYSGRRCDGEWHHCYSPSYMRADFDRVDRYHWYQDYTACRDKSDQIFPVNSVCDPLRYVAAGEDYPDSYCNLFCRPGEEHERCRADICTDPRAWLSNQTNPDILDPHHCQDSCLHPGPGCEACTHPEYFHCSRHNKSVCLHPQLVCDSHPHCDQAEDEELTTGCYDRLLTRGRIREAFQ